ncbi:hypothetical protein LWI29_016641 [Acer saccharum]|uniref:MULE transposase domain-containing protein n=1 Tax=Acer saccharum TaxID=4024 RepID=A0AA39W8J2_ACESA|nr:hypothetical protein LWI29_016641 [Acer saccharum]
MVMLIVNYDGVWEDVDFNPKTIFLLAVTPKDTLKTLSDKICERFGLNCDAVDMKFSALLSGTVVKLRFIRVIRPVVSIDATHLTGSVKGVLLIASAKDGHSKIYPLAFGFVASECKGSCTWFLSELKKGIGSPQDLVIVSDHHRGIISAMKKVFPYAQHAFCVFHIAQKFRRSSKNRSLAREFFYNAYYKHHRDECDIDLQQMATCNQREMGQGCVNVSADERAMCLCRSVPPYKNICSESDFVNRCFDSLKDLLDVTIEYKKVVERNEAQSRSRSTVVESRVAKLERDVYRLKNTKSTSLVDHLLRQEGCTLFKNRPSGSRH